MVSYYYKNLPLIIIVALLSWSYALVGVVGVENNVIKCLPSTVSFHCFAELQRDDDFRSIESISFTGMQEGDAPVTFQKTKVLSRPSTESGGGEDLVWHGVGVGMMAGFATFSRSADMTMAGSFTTDESAFALVTIPDGRLVVRATNWGDFPDSEVTEISSVSARSGTSSNAAYLGAENIVHTDNTGFVQDDKGLEEAKLHPVTRRLRNNGNLRHEASASHNRTLQQKVIVDVLVLVTNRAMCEIGGNRYPCASTEANQRVMMDKIPILQEQTNDALEEVDINVETRIVETIFLNSNFDGRPSTSTLDVLLTDSNARAWRNEAGADLIAILTGADSFTCGIAYLNTPVSATSYTCLEAYTFTHELGHNFGANHERDSTPSNQFHPYGHGYQYENRYRTMMAYDCPRRCPKVPLFSADGYVLASSNTPLGDADHDNAKLISLNAPGVSQWRASQEPVVPPPTPPPSPPVPPTTPVPVPPTTPVPVPPPTSNPVPPPSPAPVPPPQPALTCGPSPKCPGQNLYHRPKVWFVPCDEECIEEGSNKQWYYRVIFGYRCGSC